MAEVIQKLQFKRGTKAALTAVLVGTEVLSSGEPAYETDTQLVKIGDGVHNYADLPYLSADLSNYYTKDQIDVKFDDVDEKFLLKQDVLVSGTNIKTINEQSVLGAGNIDIALNEESFKFNNDIKTMYTIGKYEGTIENPVTINASGKTFIQVWNDIFSKEVAPTKVNPAVSIVFEEAGSYEVGTVVTPTYAATLSPGSYSYGPATGVVAQSWVVTSTAGDSSTTASGIFNNITVADDTNYKITATATHNEGAIPVTNIGNPFPDAQIAAGSKAKDSEPITGFRQIFWGYSTVVSNDLIDSNVVRALVNKKANAALNKEFLNADTAAKCIIIAAPIGTRIMDKVTMPSSSYVDVTSYFVKLASAVNVEGLNGYTAAEYDIWVYRPAKMAGTYEITMK